jgi:hypothetical protein
MVTGQLVLNTVTDAGMLVIFEACNRNAGLAFQPQAQFQAVNQQVQRPGPAPGQPGGVSTLQTFNNVTLTWAGAAGLKVLAEVLQKLADLP